MNAMSCYICGEDGEVGVRALCREHQERLPLLEGVNTALLEALKAIGKQAEDTAPHDDDLKDSITMIIKLARAAIQAAKP